MSHTHKTSAITRPINKAPTSSGSARPEEAVATYPKLAESAPAGMPAAPSTWMSRRAILESHIKQAQTRQSLFRQPDAAIYELDVKHLPDMVAYLNQKNPQLYLQHFNSSAAFVESLKIPPERKTRSRAIFKMDGIGNELHYSTADIVRLPGQPPSLILVEMGTMAKEVNPVNYRKFVNQLRDLPELKDSRVVVIDAKAQRSNFDCIIFALTAASKMERESATFNRWHQQLMNTGDIEKGGFVQSQLMDGVKIVKGTSVLPPAFFKHAHSLELLRGERAELLKAVVNRLPKSPKTLTVHHEEYFDPRTRQTFGDTSCNVSIEYKRINLLTKILDGIKSPEKN